MVIRRKQREHGQLQVELLDARGESVPVVSAFLHYLAARDCSPNTLVAYAHDLQHFWRFLDRRALSWDEFRPPHALELLEYLRTVTHRRSLPRVGLTLLTVIDGKPAACLAASTINRILAAVSSFYEFAILSGKLDRHNPIEQRPDPALRRVSERHRPFMAGASRQRPVRRSVRVKTVQRLPRPLSDEQVAVLLGAVRCQRDLALVRLMLDGGLRPGEALGLHLEDIASVRRRVVIRHRNDHPKGVRAKSRTERVVDLHEPATLAAVSRYVMTERPAQTDSPFLFLVGGRGARRLEPLGYPALAKLFARACERADIRAPWLTPHSLRHTQVAGLGMRNGTSKSPLRLALATSC